MDPCIQCNPLPCLLPETTIPKEEDQIKILTLKKLDKLPNVHLFGNKP
jgi:hypothetical protein